MPAPPDLGVPDQLVTLVDGDTFCVCRPDGSITAGGAEGFYHRDVRLLSGFALSVDGTRPRALAARRDSPRSAAAVFALATGDGPGALLLLRREVSPGRLCDRFELHARGREVAVAARVGLASDLANLLTLRRPGPRPAPLPLQVQGDGTARAEGDGCGVQLRVAGEGTALEAGSVTWTARPAPGRPGLLTLTVRALSAPDEAGEQQAAPPERLSGHTFGHVPGHPFDHAPGPALELDSPVTRWSASVRSALADLSAMRVYDPRLNLSYVGAGAPWYMALFGRDALLTAWEALLAGPELGLDVLEALARFQGARHDPASGEQPGRILHELRTGAHGIFGLPPGRPYYGSVDASPLFVMLLGELWRWGADPDRVRALMPAARAALNWCVEHGDVDGDGYVESVPDPRGLVNLGWKDSPDAMVHADGTLAQQPVALAEVQGYLHAAFESLAALEDAVGQESRARALRSSAARLRASFVRDFWLPDRGLVVMALDARKRPLAVASTNMGHCLWAGLLDGELADAVAGRLVAPDLASAWGLRTLGSGELGYDPLSYHRGSVWPHDTALCIAGLARVGHRASAGRLVDGLLAAAERFDWRLPELFAGFGDEQVPFPVPYPRSCSPQAWSAAVSLLLLRVVLGLEPDVPAGRLRLAPALPADVELRVRGIRVGAGQLDLWVRGGEFELLTCPPGVEVVSA